IFATLAPGRGTIPLTPGRQGGSGVPAGTAQSTTAQSGTAQSATAEEGYLHCGPSGAGHFVKMVHNGIEYGLIAAYAGGLNILKHADVGKRGRAVDAENTPLRNPEHLRYDFSLADFAEA